MAEIDYPAILEEAWQQHLGPRADNAPTVISTFAGCGGSSLGYSMAGYRELLAVEWDDNAVETFRLNFPDVPVYHSNIAKLSVDECLRLAGVESGDLDILDGSPPCQGFSTAGKRVLGDDRNQLFREYVRLLRGLRPKVFVMENVPGLVKGKMKLVFAEIMRELKASGYTVKCKKLNAKYFFVPQSRERLIFIGLRDDLSGEASYPVAESIMYTPRDAFENIPKEKIEDYRHMPEWMKDAARIMVGGNYSGVKGMDAFLKTKGTSGGGMGTKLLAWDTCSCTLPKSEIACCGIIHPGKNRYLSIPEAKRIGAFPDGFQLLGGRNEKWARIGNSVPPLFMRSIARHIRTHMLEQQPERQTNGTP